MAPLAYANLRAHASHRIGSLTLTVQIGDGPSTGGFRAEIRPNCSMSPRGLVVTMMCLAAVCLIIALGFFVVGLWLVLPFAGLEIFVVGLAVGYTLRRSRDYEIIEIDGADIVVTKHVARFRGNQTHRFSFQKYWARVCLTPGRTRLRNNRLTIGSHGRFVEIGAQITDEAREKLAARLKHALQEAV